MDTRELVKSPEAQATRDNKDIGKESITAEDLDLSELEMEKPTEFTYNGQHLSITMKESIVNGFDWTLALEGKNFEIRDKTEGLIMEFHFVIDYGNYDNETGLFVPIDPPEMKTRIEKLKEFKADSRYAGLGMILERKFLEFIAKSAEKGKRFLHTIKHEPKLGLNSDRWNEKFRPLLEEMGYTEIKQGSWKKIFDGKK